MSWTEVTVAAISLITGGGLVRLLTLRSTLRKEKSKQQFDDFEAIQEIITEAREMQRTHLKEYSELLTELQTERKLRIEYESKYNECIGTKGSN